MQKQLISTVTILSAIILCYSCSKTLEQPVAFEKTTGDKAAISFARNVTTPFKFERVNENNFYSQGWREQQVNLVAGTTVFSSGSDHVEIVCGPENNNDTRLIHGAITMNLPTGSDPTLRRIRLRRAGYSGTRLADITELKYSSYVIRNAATIMVLQVDVNNDDTTDFNIFFNPIPRWQGGNFPPILLNEWQQWNALQGTWHIEGSFLPEFPDSECTIEELVNVPQYADARIIDMPPEGHQGEGVRFTIGGTPRSDHDNTIGYFDALIIGTKDRQHSTLFDFACNHSHH